MITLEQKVENLQINRAICPVSRLLATKHSNPPVFSRWLFSSIFFSTKDTQADPAFIEKPYNEARQSFKTKLIKQPVTPDGPAIKPPKGSLWKKISFNAPLGKNVAYLAMPKEVSEKLPVLIWARGGHGGLGSSQWIWDSRSDLNEALKAVKKNKLILFVPSWRGDNANPGKAELFLGEIDDALAAIDFVASLPNVDVQRIYMAGHSTGGTVAVLTSIAAKDRLRAVFGFGGVMNNYYRTYDGSYGYAPFKQRDALEAYVRSPINYVSEITIPTFHFAGYTGEEVYCFLAEDMAGKAKLHNVPFYSYCINGGDHFNYVSSVMDLVVRKILKDTGDKMNIGFFSQEAQLIFNIAVETGKATAIE